MTKIVKIKRSFWTNHHWFSLGIHVDFDKKYADIHLGKKLIVFGNNKIPDYPPEIKAKMDCAWKEYCKTCKDLERQACSMGCHDN